MKKIFTLFTILLCLSHCDFPTEPEDNSDQIQTSSVAIYGDTQGQTIHALLLDTIIDTQPKAIFHVGDMVHIGESKEEWDIFLDIIDAVPSNMGFYPALGNHDKNSPIFYEAFDLPNNERWYSVDVEITHFIILDSNTDIYRESEQFQWLENDLLNASLDPSIKYISVMFHHPIFSSVKQHNDEKNFKVNVIPLFEKYGVDIVFSGHAHNYERSFNNGIIYITTGGGGGEIFDKDYHNKKSIIFKQVHHFCILYYVNEKMIVESVLYGNISKHLIKIIDHFEVE